MASNSVYMDAFIGGCLNAQGLPQIALRSKLHRATLLRDLKRMPVKRNALCMLKITQPDYTATLERAASLVGGRAELAAALKVSERRLEYWIEEKGTPPHACRGRSRWMYNVFGNETARTGTGPECMAELGDYFGD